jgi:PilZ domain
MLDFGVPPPPVGCREGPLAAGVPCLVVLPPSWTDFFEVHGPIRCEYSDRRAFRRVHFRGEALLTVGDEHFRVYTKDLSRGGMSFLHHKQLFPLDRVAIWWSSDDRAQLEVIRCTRLGECCYACGSRAVDEADRDALLKVLRAVVAAAPV